MYTYKAKLIKVVDGDTADFLIDLGFFVSKTVRIRFAHINSPELKTQEGKDAKLKLEQMLISAAEITLKVLGPDKYQPRWVAEVYTEKEYINQYMVDMGYATQYK